MTKPRLGILFLLLCAACVARAEEPAQQDDDKFIRVRRNADKKVIGLDTAVTRFYIPTGQAPTTNPRANDSDKEGNTALHLAAEKGYTEIVKKLLAEGADPDAKNAQGETPLLLATKGGHKEIVDLLLKAQKTARQAARPGKGEVTIDLISAVHIGDEAYYARLNDRFDKYDVVLYELVAPKGQRPAQRRNPNNPLAFLQLGAGELLELEHQLEGVDYKKENFVHADMSPADIQKSMNKRGESVLKIVLRALAADAPPQQQQDLKDMPKDLDGFMKMMLSPDRAVRLKRMMASQFENIDDQMAVLFPQGSTIIEERNKVALKVLKEQITSGKKKIAIFYGAGHMKDMAARLKKDFRAKQYENEWITAWDLRKGKRSKNPLGLPFPLEFK